MKKRDYFYITFVVSLGVLTRTVFHLGPNIEFITAISLASGYFIKNRKYSIIVPLVVMFTSDFIIGNTKIYLFTWSAFLLAPLWGRVMKSYRLGRIMSKGPKVFTKTVSSGLFGVAFTLFFFLWTNLGVVVVSDMYPKTIEGLLMSYQMGLPFLLNQLIGNLIIVPAIFLISNIFYSQKLLTGMKRLQAKCDLG